jgi:phosphotransferase system enzyme I (PtsP)
MLKSLRNIIQEVNAAKDLPTALGIIVRRVKAVMNTEVCSVYILDPGSGRYVFMATEGLNESLEGKISLSANEGIIGQVIQREEPLNLEDAEQHPSYKLIAEMGEERFSSLLGVPIIHHREVLGVLVVQQQARRRYSENEEAFLVTLSAQLAGVVAHASAVGDITAYLSGEKKISNKFIGLAGSPGVAIGKAVVMSPPADLRSIPSKKTSDPDQDIREVQAAFEEVKRQISKSKQELSGRLQPGELALFDAYSGILEDKAFVKEIYDRVQGGEWAQGAVSQVVLEHTRVFESMEDPYLKERGSDLNDLGCRLLNELQESDTTEQVFPENTILIGEDITPAMLGLVPEDRLVGIVSLTGSSNSHVAIMARGMGLPTVMGAVDLPYTDLESAELIVDGYEGMVYSNPSDDLHSRYRLLWEEEQNLIRDLESLVDQPCITRDGHGITLLVNTGLLSGMVRSLGRGADGVGLYRTEIPFLLRERFPSEEEQRVLYREQLEAFAPKPVTMRTLDVGGDKALPYFPIEEANPFLGWRGIRVTLDHPEIFLVQVRAMLKASEGLDNLRIMLPMISNVGEVDEAVRMIVRAHREVVDEGYPVRMPPVGVMVEVPAAVYQAGSLAKRVSFLSVGSNDLTQYLLAVDRNNPRVAELYHSYHPAVLNALQKVVQEGHRQGREVSICGELAGDPGAAILLIGMGYDVLSMNARSLTKVKSTVAKFSLKQARDLLDQVREMETAEQIYRRVQSALKDAGISTRFIGPAPRY